MATTVPVSPALLVEAAIYLENRSEGQAWVSDCAAQLREAANGKPPEEWPEDDEQERLLKQLVCCDCKEPTTPLYSRKCRHGRRCDTCYMHRGDAYDQ